MVSVGIAVCRVEHAECDQCEIFRGRRHIQHDRLVIFQRFKKLQQLQVSGTNQESVVPFLHQLRVRNALYLRVVHHHSLLRGAGLGDNVAGQRDFHSITMAMQVAAFAIVGRYAVAGVEFQPASN